MRSWGTECVGGQMGKGMDCILKMQWGCSAALMAILVYVCCFSYRLLRPSPSKGSTRANRVMCVCNLHCVNT